MKPIRIQRKRTKGWRMPENTYYVGRGSYFGNPYKISEGFTQEECVKEFVNWLKRNFDPRAKYINRNISWLKGRNLACWCKEGTVCHADILLKLANE
jgi:hypothetical protein